MPNYTDKELRYKQAMRDAIVAVAYFTLMWVGFILIAVLLILGV